MHELCLMVSNICNFACKNCHVFQISKIALPPGVMNFTTMDLALRSYLSVLNKHSVKQLMVRFYGGEILINRVNVFKLIETFNNESLGIGIHWLMHTNGSLLDDDDAVFLKRNNVDVHISCDGHADTHNLNRLDKFGQPTFDRVKSGLELIRKHKLTAQLNSFAMPENLAHLKDLVDIAKQYGIDRVFVDYFYSKTMLPKSQFLPEYIAFLDYAERNNIKAYGPFSKFLDSYLNKEAVSWSAVPSLVVNSDSTFFFSSYPLSRKFRLAVGRMSEIFESNYYKEFAEATSRYYNSICQGCPVCRACCGDAIRQYHYHVSSEEGYRLSCEYTRAIMAHILEKCTV